MMMIIIIMIKLKELKSSVKVSVYEHLYICIAESKFFINRLYTYYLSIILLADLTDSPSGK